MNPIIAIALAAGVVSSLTAITAQARTCSELVAPCLRYNCARRNPDISKCHSVCAERRAVCIQTGIWPARLIFGAPYALRDIPNLERR
jgi:hypothetical protein